MRSDTSIAEVLELLRQGSRHLLREKLTHLPPAELVALLGLLNFQEEQEVFELLPPRLATRTFEFLAPKVQVRLLEKLPTQQVAAILNTMSPDDRTALLEYLPNTIVRELIALLSEGERKVTLELLGYPEFSVGRLMTPDYIAVREHWTVQQVLDYVRKHGSDSETLSMLYVTDEKGKLLDDIRIREFLVAPLDRKVSEIMDHRFVALHVRQDQEEAVKIFHLHDRYALPVLDDAGLLFGIVTIDDMLQLIRQEDTEDIQKLGGTEALEEPYLAIPLLQMVRKRGVWLVVLFLGEMFTATAMSYFEDEIAKAVVLALFVPLIISSGGNTGSQATTLIIRAMAVGDIRMSDWWRVFRRELLAGVLLGLMLGFIGFLRIVVWSQFSNAYGEHHLLLGLVVGFSLVGVVLWGSLSGAMLPLLLRRAGLDPATSSAPFVATLVDVTGLVIYFSIAYLFLRGTLL